MKDYKRRKRKRLFSLWFEDPHCHWCGCPTVLVMRPDSISNGNGRWHSQKEEATIDHLRSRFDPTRQEPNDGGTERTVLSCYHCNQKRCQAEELSIPLEERWLRSGRYPKESDDLEQRPPLDAIGV